MQIMRRVFLVHGLGGNPNGHWFPWLKRELSEYGFTVFSLAMPNPSHPTLSEWLAEFSRSVVLPDEQTYFVGHSLGCISIARYIATLPEKVQVGGAVFVGGFSGELEWAPKIKEFCVAPFDPERVKQHCRGFVFIASEDDDSVPFEASRAFHVQLGGKFVAENGKGHFCADNGVTELPSALDAVLALAGVLK